VLVRPELVVEIAFDAVQSSTRSLAESPSAFPRVRYYRPDKRPEEVKTSDELRSLLSARR
jgi:DNA ligase-1